MSLNGVIFLYKNLSFLSHIINPHFELSAQRATDLMNALEMFANNLYNDQVESITLGDQRISTYRVNLYPPDLETSLLPEDKYFTIISFAERDMGDRKISHYLDRFKKNFFKFYTPDDIIQWDGNILDFLPFKSVLNRILESEDELDDKFIAVQKEFLTISNQTAAHGEAASYFILNEMGLIEDSFSVKIDHPPHSEIVSRIKQDLEHTNNLIWDGIIPFLDRHQIAYIFVVKFQNEFIYSKERHIRLTHAVFCYYLKDKYQIFLPKLIPKFKAALQIPTSQLICCSNTNYNDILTRSKSLLEQMDLMASIFEETNINIKFTELLNLKKNDVLVSSLITNRSIAIIGDEYISQRLINQLIIFSPHRSLNIQFFPKEPLTTQDVDIVVISSKDKKDYKDFLIVNLEKMKVQSNLSCKFSAELIENLQKLDDPYITSLYIKRKINWLLSKATLIRNLSWEEGSLRNEINAIRSDLDECSERIILRLAEGRNPQLQNLCDFLSAHFPISKISLDEHFVKFNDHKILVSNRMKPEMKEAYFQKLIKMGTMILGPRMMKPFLPEKG